jgi:hypothetical protein
MTQLSGLYAAIGNSLNVTPEERSALVELTLARKIAFMLPLPSAPVDGMATYYADQCGSLIRNKVSEFNEEFPLNTVAVLDMVFTFWTFRYYMVHPVGDEFAGIVSALVFSPTGNRLKESLSPVHAHVAKGTIAWAAEELIRDFVIAGFSI